MAVPDTSGMSIPASDADEWRAARSGDGEAFARVFDRHQSRVFRHSLALVPSIDDAQDVVGITFLEAWRKRASVRFVSGSLLPWLLVTATHSSRNVSRSARRYRALLERVPRSESLAGPEELLDEGPAVAALRDLAPHHRDVITLCVIEGLSEAEAGEALGVPSGTVKSRLHRAKKALASRLLAPSLLTGTTETSGRR
ncbi:RNA polymerase sigma-70 factor (ECF subfamily) [Rathayibacter sp. PhB179]|uniref:RNA polymerase sigma factor n=2 Tax=unclassified Rathayibacter TaxID=2609250 RepID=UPI0010F01762|nr:RNA polymerase sigma factor [Rathayibacter sp. PhB179]TCL79388.1 RNA polymerase sigma-70 factor (ECF subfamily) [Rathayibacter sp. PhB192]TCM25344.1 RNA polymerase sigma-70 factor (ECF subfamily) [Rathayibacter sp. PhB179]